MKASVTKILILSIITASASMTFLSVPARSSEEAETKKDERKIIERVIKIEGSPEKPRTIFIVPKARLWDSDISKKSFREVFLEPVLPGPTFKGREDKK
jgi:hypothetical protein